MIVVLKGQCAFVVENGFGFGEADAFVLEFVGCILAFVVLNLESLHYAYFICIKKSATLPSVAVNTSA
jgi:hypothetical protein